MVGALDPSFGTDGTVTTSFGGQDQAAAVALQTDGKIVVVGSGEGAIEVVRYNPDGSLDSTFGTGGKLELGGGVGFGATGTALAIQSNGQIVVVGNTIPALGSPSNGMIAENSEILVYRINTNGTIDTTFGASPIIFGRFNQATGVAIQSNGQIVVAGTTSNGEFDIGNSHPLVGSFAVARLNTDGTLDTTFNGTGMQTVSFEGNDGANAVTIQPNGDLVLAGYAGPSNVAAPAVAIDFAVARLTPGGILDTTFDGTGKETVDFGFSDVANAVALQSNGDIVLAGTATGSSPDFAIARFLPGGGLDSTFNTTGKVEYNIGADDEAAGVAVQPDGKIVVVGTTNTGGSSGATGVVLRLTSAGDQDLSFGPHSTELFGTGTHVVAAGVALTPTGRIVVVGDAQVTSTPDSSALIVSRLIGTVEEGRDLAVGGSLDGQATVYAPAPGTLGYYITPIATINALGGPTANVRTAVGDVNGDGVQDIIMVTGPGTPIRVTVVSGVDDKTVLVPPFDPFGGNFTGGGFVAVGDFDNSGREDIIVTPDQGGGPRVAIFQLQSTGLVQLASFYGITDPNFRGGARVATGDFNGDGVTDLAVAAGYGGGPRIAIFDGRTVLTTQTKLISDFFVFSDVLRNGVYIAAGDVNGDGYADLIIGAGPGGGPEVMILSGQILMSEGATAALAAPLSNFFVGGTDSNRGGERVAALDIEGDNKADVAVASGTGQPSLIRVYDAIEFTSTAEPTVFQDLNPYSTTFADGVYVG
jgi:uncharacterized delta-60 repeat protein